MVFLRGAEGQERHKKSSPVLELVFSQLFQVRWGEHGSILQEPATHSLWVFHQQTGGAFLYLCQVSAPLVSLGAPAQTVRQKGSDSAHYPQQHIPETSGEHGGGLWWEYQLGLYFLIFRAREKTTIKIKKGIGVGESWPLVNEIWCQGGRRTYLANRFG